MKIIEIKIRVDEKPGEDLTDDEVEALSDALDWIDWSGLATAKIKEAEPELAERVVVREEEWE